jgi:hypothetical protein
MKQQITPAINISVDITEAQNKNILRVLRTDTVALAVLEVITCPICRQVYKPKGNKSAKMLKCSHSFCFDCIRSVKDNQKHKFTCPTCNEITYFKRHGEGLLDNIHIRTLLEAAALQFEKKSSCSSCQFSTPHSGLHEMYLCNSCYSKAPVAINPQSMLRQTPALDLPFQQMQQIQAHHFHSRSSSPHLGSKRSFPTEYHESELEERNKKLNDQSRNLMNNILLNEIDFGNALTEDTKDRSGFLNIEFAITDE